MILFDPSVYFIFHFDFLKYILMKKSIQDDGCCRVMNAINLQLVIGQGLFGNLISVPTEEFQKNLFKSALKVKR